MPIIIVSDEVKKKKSKTILAAEEMKIHVVAEDVLDGFPEESITTLIKRKTISEWGSNVSLTTALKFLNVIGLFGIVINDNQEKEGGMSRKMGNITFMIGC